MMRRIVRALVLCLLFGKVGAGEAADPPTMTHGPLLGQPAAMSMRVWARTSLPCEFEVRYGLRPGQFDQKSAVGKTAIAHDNTGWLTLEKLTPDTRYHYQVFSQDLPQGSAGTFRTLPSAALVRHEKLNPRGLFNVKFEIGCCSNQNPLHGIGHSLPLYQTMNRSIRDDVQFHIMNGDWLYEELRETSPEAWRMTLGLKANEVPRTVQAMPTIVGVWENYKLYLSRGVPLAEWHRNMPSMFTADDHEIVNDIWGAGSAGRRHRRTVFRDIGTQAWYDYLGWANPTTFAHPLHFGIAKLTSGSDLLVDSTADFTKLTLSEMSNLHIHWGTPTAGVNDLKLDDDSGDPNSRVYDIVKVVNPTTLQLHMPAKETRESAYSIGRRNYGKLRVSNCDIFLLDTRSHREMHDVREPSKPGLTILGKHQRDWLLKNMRESDADFLFVVSSVPFMVAHNGAGGFEFDEKNKEESWVAFLDEREMLIREWDKLKKPVCVMTGDLHNSFAIKITDRVWEFCCGPHNSVNHVPSLDEEDRPATGKFMSGNREADIRWSSYILPDIPRLERCYPYYCVVQVNNVFNMPQKQGDSRWVAYPHPQVIFQYYEGRTGKLAYAEAVSVER